MSPVPDEDRIPFFVFIVESPSDLDFYHDRAEGRLLAEVIRHTGVPTVLRVAITRQALVAALHYGLVDEMKANPERLPILHISAHGSAEGIQLASGEALSWQDLRDILKPVNAALKGSLFICLSTCQGYSGTQMAMYPDDEDFPYFALIGCAASPTWAETSVGFATLYHQVARGEYVEDAVEIMRRASGNDAFYLRTAEDTKKDYIEYLKSIDAGDARHELTEATDAGRLGDMVKYTGSCA
ncbi:MAG: hypothetical protein H3C62_06330 [Gemmatimonadaceae bacterium]|nr:hypothetical protein [Gemmatimonadaceae bacterium]